MKELLMIAIGSALVNNVVLSQFLGICPFLGVSKKVETAAGMGAAVIFVITLASFAGLYCSKKHRVPVPLISSSQVNASIRQVFFKVSLCFTWIKADIIAASPAFMSLTPRP